MNGAISLIVILLVVIVFLMFKMQNQIDKLWYFHKHGHDKEAEQFRKYIGEK